MLEYDLEKARAEVARIEREIKAEEKRLAKMTPAMKMAETIHDATCTWNHTDGCGWFYESWDLPGYTRRAMLSKVSKIEKALPPEVSIQQAIDIYKLLRY